MASGIELATAYVKLQVDGDNLDKSARMSGQQAGRDFAEGFDESVKKSPAPDPGKGSERKSRESGGKSGRAYASAFDKVIKTQVRAALESLPDAKVDADATPAQRAIANLRTDMAKLGDKKIGVDLDSGTAAAEISRIKGQLDALSTDSDIGVRVDAGAASVALGRVEAAVARVDGKTAEIDVDANTAGAVAKLNALNIAARGSGGGMSSLIVAALALAPAIIPLGAAAIGAAAGFGAMGLAAGAGAGVIALALGPVGEATKALDAAAAAGGRSAAANRKAAEAMAGLTPAARETVTLIRGPLRTALESMQKTAGGAFLPGFNTFLRAVPGAMKQLTPLVTDLGKRLGGMAASAGAALGGPFWSKFVSFLSSNLGPWLTTTGKIIANLAKGFVALFMRVSPLADQFGGTIQRLTAKFAAWATSGGSGAFERFLTYAKQSLPVVISFIGAFAGAFGNVTVALAPLGPIVLGLMTSFARMVAGMDPNHVRAYALALGALFGIYKLLKVAIAVSTVATNAHALATRLSASATRSSTAAENAGVLAKARAKVATIAHTVAEKARTIATKAGTAAQWLMNAAMRANPIGLLITGLIALGVSLVVLWKKSQTFRTLVMGAWNGIKAAASAVVSWFTNTAWPWMRNVFGWIGARAMWLYRNAIAPAWRGIRAAVSAVVNFFRATVWPVLSAVFGWIARRVKWLATAYFKVYFAIIRTAVRAVAWFIRDVVWPIFRNVFGWIAARAKWLYTNGIRPAFNWITSKIGSVYRWFRDTVWPIYSKVFGWIASKAKWLYTNGIRPAFNWITSKIGSVYRWFRDTVWSSFSRSLDGIRGAFTAAKDGIGDTWKKIEGLAKKPVEFAVNTVFGGLLDAVGKIPGMGGTMKSLKTKMGIPIKLATGGIVPGHSPSKTADNIPIMATAKEFVTRVSSAERMRKRFPGYLEHINRHGTPPMAYATGGRVGSYGGEAFPRYAKGGYVGENKGRTGLYAKLVALGRKLQKMGIAVGQHRAFGSNPRYGRRGGSLHGYDLALDINGPGERNGQFDSLARSLWSQGWGVQWKSPGHYDHMHIDTGLIGRMFGQNRWARNPSAGKLGGGSGLDIGGGMFDFVKNLTSPLKSMLAKFKNNFAGQAVYNVAKDAGSKIKSWIGDKIGDLMPDVGMGGVATSASALISKEQVRGVAAKYGWHTGAQWDAIVKLVQGESSWNYKIRNKSSGAAGLFQKMPMHGPVEKTAAGQAEWGLRYIANRPDYGTPLRAYRKWLSRSPHWYADGGRVAIPGYAKGGVTKPGLALVGERGPEIVDMGTGGQRVYTNTESKQMVAGQRPSITINVTGVEGDPNTIAGAVASRFNYELDRRGRYAGVR